jgi:7-cyano-7-deazaguanine synthase
MKENKKHAIILASGGLDSFVTAYHVKEKFKEKISLLFFDYGQQCLNEELFCVKKLAKKLKSRLKVINLKWLGDISTSLINKGKGGKEEIIKWYVPCRNSLFLISALAHAESDFLSKNKKTDIYIGVKYEGELSFKDTTSEFIRKINELTKKAVQKGEYKIKAPFLYKDKEDIIEIGKNLGVNFQDTYSCYIGKGFKITKKNGISKKIPIHCGKCAGCLARKKGFKFSNVEDNSLYLK